MPVYHVCNDYSLEKDDSLPPDLMQANKDYEWRRSRFLGEKILLGIEKETDELHYLISGNADLNGAFAPLVGEP